LVGVDGRDGLDELWGSVLVNWDNGKLHDVFVQTAMARGELGCVAANYRAQLEDPNRREMAQKRLDSAMFLAVQMMESEKSVRVRVPLWCYVAATVTCVVALAILVWSILT